MAREWIDSNSERLRVLDDSILDVSAQDFSMMCWVYPTGTTSGDVQHILSKWQSYVFRLANTTGGGGFFGFLFTIFDTATPVHLQVGSVPTLNQWYHVTCRFDGTTLDMQVWDPVAQTTNDYTASHSGGIDSTSTDLIIGQFQDGQESFRFNGRIAEAKIWNNQRLGDGGQILLHRWTSHLDNVGPNFYLPILGADDPEPDFSGNGNSATPGGFALPAAAGHAPIPLFTPDPNGHGHRASRTGVLNVWDPDTSSWLVDGLDGQVNIYGGAQNRSKLDGDINVHDNSTGDFVRAV